MSQEAVVKNKKSIYIVWIIPVVAMIMAGWMIFKHYDEKGFDIKITFDDASGMAVGKTALMYNGIKIGQVSNMEMHPNDISKIDVTVTVEKVAQGVARAGNVFWKVEPKLSLTEVSGLSTILGGVYIGVMPETSDPVKLKASVPKYTFEALDDTPINIFNPGLLIYLHASTHDIKVGAPIMYRKMSIGKVLDSKLTDKGVDYTIQVNNKYKSLIKKDSQFWKISGMEIRASLAGIRVSMESLASVVAGGISVSSPIGSELQNKDHSEYKLYKDIDHLNLNKNIITLVSNDGYNIDIKAAHVFFKGSNAGDIIALDYNPATDKTTFQIKLKDKFYHLANKDARFWIVEPEMGLNGVNGLGAITRGPYVSFETTTKSKKMKNKFTLYKSPAKAIGKHFKLVADNSFSLKDGINVIHKNIIIGSLRTHKLARDNNKVLFDIVVAHKYKHLINNSSSFYIQGAMEVDASFEGMYLNIGSITSMVNSGIVLKTPDLKAKSTYKEFLLVENYKTFKNNQYTKDGGKTFTLVTNDLKSVKSGSPIIYKGIRVGKVLSFYLNKTTSEVELKIYIKREYSDQVNSSTNFFNVSGVEIKAGLNGVKLHTSSFESIVNGGIAFKTPLKADAVKNMHTFTLYRDKDAVDEKYIDISFLMNEDSSLKEGSAIVYKSVNIGQVKELKLIDDEVIIYAIVKEEHKNLLVKDSIFWTEDVEMSIDHIKNPSSIISGAFIKVLKGNSSEFSKRFSLASNSPAPTINKKGLRVLVKASRLSSLKVGSPVFYRQIQIGKVEGYGLSKDSKGVELKLFIDECYSYLVRDNSIFYNATAMGMDISLFGVKVSTETISTMIHGGITMVVPNNVKVKAQEMKEFKLHDAPEEDWIEYTPELINDNVGCVNSI
ncbi:MAG: hypothetical protein DRG78_13800 [Epsilonproteobacteria bacterium]|nr:MAG: hypothetical protein DRG78_13800 [Campylobacterota bacterium]